MTRHAAVGAHIYAGGFTAGVSRHFDVMAHLEHAAYGRSVVELNFPGMPIHVGGPVNWPEKFARRPRFLYANPPCAIWSSASEGRLTHWSDDPRLQVHHDVFDYALKMNVDVFTIESVPPSFTDGRPHVDSMIERAATAGYSFTAVRHDAQWLGVAQRRCRYFYTFHKIEVDWQTPEFEEPTTVRQALKSLPRRRGKLPGPDTTPSPATLTILPHVPPGGSLRTAYERMNPDPPLNRLGHRIGSPSFLAKRVAWDRPSPVVISGNMYHPEENRYLSRDELASLCSFPPDYRWPDGSMNDLSGFMSRGVMPKVGEWLAGNVARSLDRNRRINDPRREVLDVSAPPGSLVSLEDHDNRRTYHMPKNVKPTAPARGTPVVPDVAPGEGSGAYMRRLLTMGISDNATILEAVHRQFPGSKAGPSDVSYNKNKLKNGAATDAPATPKKYATTTAPRQTDIPFDGAKPIAKSSASGTDALRAKIKELQAGRSTDALAAMLLSIVNVFEGGRK